jgi:periodic tryptophan protein 2
MSTIEVIMKCLFYIRKEFFPFHLERTFPDFSATVTSFDWSPDSNYLLAGSKDLTMRILSLKGRQSENKPFLFLGHREPVVGAFFAVDKKNGTTNRAYSVSRDGVIFTWDLVENMDNMDTDSDPVSTHTEDQNLDAETDHNNLIIKFENPTRKRKNFQDEDAHSKPTWRLRKKDLFMQLPARLTACDYHRELDMVVVGFSNGVFGLYQMPDFVCLHLLSISREKITTAAFNRAGNWLLFGCAKLGQLLVWEWKSESYVFKQQGHYFDVNCVAYSPDSQLLATGADDNKVKVQT